MPTINLGRVGFVNKGTYDNAFSYKINDIVTYNNGTYACIQNNTGIDPTNVLYWKVWIDNNVIRTTGDYTVGGKITHTNSPIVPTPVENEQAANKLYVDTKLINIDEGKVHTTGNETISGIKTFTSTISGNITGNSGTATKLATERTINGVNFDGSANITVSDPNAVKLTGNETITGVKTFSSNIVGNITGSASLNLSLTGGTMTGAITAIRETKVAMTTNNINLATGNLFTKTITTATTLTVSNVLGSGNANSFILELTNGGVGVITWWSGMKWAGGTAPTLTTSGVDILGFYSHDGGVTWRGMIMAKDSK